ncbi:MAG: hypothetical protein DMD91_10000 [Candidatus Rokuibacteriota bacterium]|nr:MAG: hypothetical protein DMD91_10000 [Candidatus Rokubacteria bacterium]
MSEVDWAAVKALAYEEAATTPQSWLNLADDLRRAAEAVWAPFEDALPRPGRPSRAKSSPFGYGAVFLMLAGLAIENLAKGLVVQRKPPEIKDGKAVGIAGHGILARLKSAAVPLTNQDREFIRRLEMFVSWAGRYPIPLHVAQMKVEKTIHTTDGDQFKALFDRLKTLLLRLVKESQ